MNAKLHMLPGGAEPKVTACATCRHVRPATGFNCPSARANFQVCAAIGTHCSSVRRRDATSKRVLPCELWERAPDKIAKPRVGLLRWLWRLLW